jgi:predicted peptidase
MATTKIGFLILELEERGKEILKKEKIQKLETEAHAIRLQMVQEIKKLDNDKLHTTFQVTHAGKTRLFTIDSNGNIKKENQVIKA